MADKERERLLLLAAAKAKAERESSQDEDDFNEDASSFAEGVGAFGVGAAKQIPLLGSNIEQIAATLAANPAHGDPLRGEILSGQLDPEAVEALAAKYRGMTGRLKEKYPVSYGAGAASSIGAQFLAPGTVLTKIPRALRFVTAPTLAAISSYLERPEGAEAMTPEEEHAARVSQAKWGGGTAGVLQGAAEIPAAANFAKKASRSAYEFIEPGGILEGKDILLKSKEKIGEAILPLLKGMRRSSKANREIVAERAGDIAKEVGEDIGAKVSRISDAQGTGIAPTELTARTRLQAKAAGVPGDPSAIPEAAEFAELEKNTLTSLQNILDHSPSDKKQIAERVKNGVARAREEIERTRPITAQELADITAAERRKWELYYGRVSPNVIQRMKSQAHDRIQAEFQKDETQRNLSSPLIRYYKAQAKAAKSLIGEAADKINPRLRNELDEQMERYGTALKIQSYAKKAASKASKQISPWELLKPGAAGLAAAGAIYGGESSSDSDLRDLGYLGAIPLTALAVMASPKNPALRARVLSRMSKIKADPLKFGLIGGGLGAQMTPGTSTPVSLEEE